MTPHSSTLAWKIPWMEEPGRLQSMGSLRVGHNWATSLSRIGEGNGNPLQCSCLENPRDGVAQSWTRLKWLSSSNSRVRLKSLVLDSILLTSNLVAVVLVTQSCLTLITLRSIAQQAPLSMGVAIPFSMGSSRPRDQISPGLLHWRQILCHLRYQGSPETT